MPQWICGYGYTSEYAREYAVTGSNLPEAVRFIRQLTQLRLPIHSAIWGTFSRAEWNSFIWFLVLTRLCSG